MIKHSLPQLQPFSPPTSAHRPASHSHLYPLNMVVPTPNPNTNTAPPTLTAAQTRALLHNLLSTSSNAHRPAPRLAPVKAARQQPVPQQTITIDASTRIMGHCNNVVLASSSPTGQVAKIEALLRGVFQPIGQGEEKARAKANVNLNVTVLASVNVMGSKNVVVVNGRRDDCKESTKGDEPLAGPKRRAESVSCHHAHSALRKRTLT